MYERLDLAPESGETISLLERGAEPVELGPPGGVEGDSDDAATDTEDEDVPPPPPPSLPSKPTTVSGGVLNGKAISKPQPAYPPVAKAVHASGAVTVQVTVDESGNVVEASAVSGHPLLRQAAVAAARQAKFSPTLLSGKPVKVTGVLTYNFVLE
jgi:protein TonB